MSDIVLETKKIYDIYGRHVANSVYGVDRKIFTPTFIEQLKNDLLDTKGWKKHLEKLKEHGIDIE